MLDHLGVSVSDYPKSKRFFEGALAPLGYAVMMEFGGATAGLGAGGRPGLRPEYHSNYYGAFVIDPDGNNVEAVCHQPG